MADHKSRVVTYTADKNPSTCNPDGILSIRSVLHRASSIAAELSRQKNDAPKD